MTLSNIFRFSLSQRELNAVLGALGIYALGIFSLWFPLVALNLSMPQDFILNKAVITVWQALALVVVPFVWAIKRLNLNLGDLGITAHRLGMNILLGCGLYAIALSAFMYCPDISMMTDHALRKVSTGDAITLTILMGITAAGTDIASRGYILLILAKYGNVFLAFVAQNLLWFLGHMHEVRALTGCLGTTLAVTLTITLGVVGDIIVLRTRSVVGLAIAHFMLNVVLSVYLRQF